MNSGRARRHAAWALSLILSLLLNSAEAFGTSGKRDSKSTPKVSEHGNKPFRIQKFPKDLAENFVGLFSRNNLPPLLIGSAAAGTAYAFDDNVAAYFGETDRLGKAEGVGNFLGKSWLIGGAIGGMLLASQYGGDDTFKALSYSLGQGFVLTGGLTFGLKSAVRRERPDGSNNRSFPSGHASQAFSVATIVSHYQPRATIPAYIVAGLVAASRLDRNVHYLSDVVSGALLGYLVGRTVVRRSDEQARLSVMPFASLRTGDVGVFVRIRLP